MAKIFTKVKTIHHLIDGFEKLLQHIERTPDIDKIIPWRIDRQQKWSSTKRFKISYRTPSGLKCIMSQWSTAQELFLIYLKEKEAEVLTHITQTTKNFPDIELKNAITI